MITEQIVMLLGDDMYCKKHDMKVRGYCPLCEKDVYLNDEHVIGECGRNIYKTSI